MSFESGNELHTTFANYTHRQIKPLISDIPVSDRPYLLEKIREQASLIGVSDQRAYDLAVKYLTGGR